MYFSRSSCQRWHCYGSGCTTAQSESSAGHVFLLVVFDLAIATSHWRCVQGMRVQGSSTSRSLLSFHSNLTLISCVFPPIPPHKGAKSRLAKLFVRIEINIHVPSEHAAFVSKIVNPTASGLPLNPPPSPSLLLLLLPFSFFLFPYLWNSFHAFISVAVRFSF